MDVKQRSDLVRTYRLEIKQARRNSEFRDRDAPARTRARLRPDTRSADEVRRANVSAWLNRVDRRRPRLRRDPSNEDRAAHVAATRSYQSNLRTGFRVGERLRQMREAGGFGIPANSEEHARAAARSNVRFQTRTQFSGPNGVEQILTPAERVNRVGVRSRRRRVSPGVAPLASRRGVVAPPVLPSRRR